jgi:hypothetical protein
MTLLRRGSRDGITSKSSIPSGGTGDMDRSIYDTNYNGIVDNSERVESFVQNIIVPTAVWTITHSLNKFPNVRTFNTSNQQIYGSITHNSINQVKIEFLIAITGRVECD